MSTGRPLIYEGPETSIYLATGTQSLYAAHTGCGSKARWARPFINVEHNCKVCDVVCPVANNFRWSSTHRLTPPHGISYAADQWVADWLEKGFSEVIVSIIWP